MRISDFGFTSPCARIDRRTWRLVAGGRRSSGSWWWRLEPAGQGQESVSEPAVAVRAAWPLVLVLGPVAVRVLAWLPVPVVVPAELLVGPPELELGRAVGPALAAAQVRRLSR